MERDFTAQLDEYVTWFNHERVHSYLEGLRPVQYRAQADRKSVV